MPTPGRYQPTTGRKLIQTSIAERLGRETPRERMMRVLKSRNKIPSPSGEPRNATVTVGVDPCEGMLTTGAADASGSQHGRLPLLGEGDN